MKKVRRRMWAMIRDPYYWGLVGFDVLFAIGVSILLVACVWLMLHALNGHFN